MKQTFKDFLKEEVVKLENPAQKELNKIVDWKIGGNAGDDYHLMDAIHNFLMNKKYPMNAKKVALKKLDLVMGLGKKSITDKDVEDYIHAG